MSTVGEGREPCVICYDDYNADEYVQHGQCEHGVCTGCFMQRMRVASKPPTDMVDPFSCPVCKKDAAMVHISAATQDPHVRLATKYQDALWAAMVKWEDLSREDHPPIPKASGYIPAILFCSYWHNRGVLAAAERITSAEKRAELLLSDLEPLSDTARARSKRGSATAALRRVHEGMRKRRRVDMEILDEARDLVDLLEQEEEDQQLLDDGLEADMTQFVVGGGALYLVTTVQPQGNTHMWVHTDMGKAVSVALRQSATPGTSCALIRTDELTSQVLAAVVAGDSGPGAPKAVMRTLRHGRVELTPTQADALAAQMQSITSASVSGVTQQGGSAS